jgi:cytochrome c oxidase subunit I
LTPETFSAATIAACRDFFTPMIANPFFYIGVVLVVVGSWIWVALMSINVAAWKRENPD